MSAIDKSKLNYHVLVVDDHAMTRNMVRSILRGAGFTEVTTQDSGHSAIHFMQTNSIKLIICDWNMPGGSGIEFLRLIRSDPRFQQIPFIMLTAEAYRESIEEAIKCGVTDYIAKPFTADLLTKKVASVLASK